MRAYALNDREPHAAPYIAAYIAPYIAPYIAAYIAPLMALARPVAAPPATAACACGRLRRASRALTQLYDDAMAPAGLRVTQFSLLRALARDGPQRITGLAAATLLDRTALSRNLDPLVARGLVAVAAGRDARTRMVSLTRSGAAAIRAAEKHWRRAQDEVADRLGAAKLAALIATLAEIETLHPAAARGDD